MISPLSLAPSLTSAAAEGHWLAPLAGHWIEAAVMRLREQTSVVRVTVAALRGSAPREPGASMLVDGCGTVGTIGGGQLEWHATRAAQDLLGAPNSPSVRIEQLLLGPDLGQCCGGRVELWLERLSREDLPWLAQAVHRLGNRGGVTLASCSSGSGVAHQLRHSLPGAARSRLLRTSPNETTLLERLGPQRCVLWVFGAGHVGQALVRLVSTLSLFDITWIDSRPELLPSTLLQYVDSRIHAAPTDLVATAPAGARYIVLTHDHALDYDLCRLILQRGDSAWLGLIGSASKSARFRSRLRREGMTDDALAGLTCPIGVPGIASKLPAAIAIAIAAQLLQECAPARVDRPSTARSHACTTDCASCGAERHESS